MVNENLVSSKQVHLTQLNVGDRFRFVGGTHVFKIIEHTGVAVKVKHRLADKTWTIGRDKIVIKFGR